MCGQVMYVRGRWSLDTVVREDLFKEARLWMRLEGASQEKAIGGVPHRERRGHVIPKARTSWVSSKTESSQ